MQQVFKLFSKNSTMLLFLLLLIVSLYLTIQSHSYHTSKVINSSNYVTGIVYEKSNELTEYLNLKEENELLAKENASLKQILFNSQIIVDNEFKLNPALHVVSDYKVFQSKIVKNIYSKKENYLTIKGGSKVGIKKDMGVINSKGVVGIVEQVSNNYATVQSILNVKTKIAAKVSNTDHFGTIVWDGKNAGYVHLTDIPKLAQLRKGDTIVTGGESVIFPENIPIGLVDKVYTTKTSNFYTISVRLFNDMTNLQSVYVVENIHREEIKNLEAQTEGNE